jgi:hypothetical protein
MPHYYSTREVGDLFGAYTWQVRRLFEDGTLSEPGRFVGKRAIPREMLPAILDELRKRGWVSSPAEATIR